MQSHPFQAIDAANTFRFFLLAFTSSIDETKMYVIFGKAVVVNRGLLSVKVDRL